MVALKSSAPALDAAEAQVDVAPTIALPAPALDPEEGSPQA
jgi:hypothetical protein